MVANAPIAYRQRVAVYADAKPAGATKPVYTDLLADRVPAEVRQVSGGEVVRGKQVEAFTTHVVSMRYIPTITVNNDCRITVLSGPHEGKLLWVNMVHYEDASGRPIRLQIHCNAKG